jgi:hypothetical protein
MKYIEVPELSRLAQALCHEGPECSVRTRIEAYSCKPIGRDKRLARELEQSYADEVAHSPPLPSFVEPELELATAFGQLDKHATRKTLYQLIATLNVAFPDHDFSAVRPGQFTREPSGASVLSALSTTLISPNRAGVLAPRSYSSYPPSSHTLFPSSLPTRSSPVDSTRPSPRAPPAVVSATHPVLYRALDDVIGLADAEVFGWEPDPAHDPHAGGEDDDEDVASVGDEDTDDGWDEVDSPEYDSPRQGVDEHGFPFDADFDEVEEDALASSTESKPAAQRSPSASPPTMKSPPPPSSSATGSSSWHNKQQVRHRRRGALLWSTHWFLLNRKLKRVVYITVWSRTRLPVWGVDSEESEEGFDLLSASAEKTPALPGERFFGWAGAHGAGARAMGLRAWH